VSAPALSQDDIFAKAKQLRAAGVPLEEIDHYLTAKLGGPKPEAPHSKFTSQQLVGRAARQVENAQDEQDAVDPSYAQKALGGVAALVRHVPGAEAAQSGVRALVRGQNYRDARDDIRSAEDANPVSPVNGVIGGGLAALATPGSVPEAGARYGIAHGLANADPDVDAKERLHDAAKEGAVGAASAAGAAQIGPLAKYVAGRLNAGAASSGRVVNALRAGVRAMRAPSDNPVAGAIGEGGRVPEAAEAAPVSASTPAAAPTAAPSRDAAHLQLQELLQKALDEGQAL
jgi:DNA-binding transcriptional MerR regulator